MAPDPEKTCMLIEARAGFRSLGAQMRVPHHVSFAKMAVIERISTLETLQRELDVLTESVKSEAVGSNRRGRRAALWGLRKRQMRLDKLATAFGFRRRWRLHVRAEAGSRPQSTDLN